jgi:hypothetical protein
MERVAETGKQREPSPALAGHGRVASPAASLPPALELQQLAGNQAMQQLLRSGFLQAKLAISNPDDPEEREADNVAHTILRKAAGAPCSCSPGEEMCEECQQKQSGPAIQRRASAPPAPTHVPRVVSDVLRSPGHPLDSASRDFFEPHFGCDFSDVRIHTGSEAAASARSIHAHAYTAGSHIAFDSGQYSPDTPSGRSLMAHELTHVVQQNRGASPPMNGTGPYFSHPSDWSEREATRVSQAIVNGSDTGSIHESPSATIQRANVCEMLPPAPVGTFELDPLMSAVPIPTDMSVHLRIAPPLSVEGPDVFRGRVVDLMRPVLSASRLTAYAIPLDRLTPTVCTDEPVSRTVAAGEQALAPSGLVTITHIDGEMAFTQEPNADTVGAGAIVYVETSSGTVVIDAGLQVTGPQYKKVLGAELARQISTRTTDQAVDEAVLAPGALDGPAIPYIAETLGIRAIRATRDLYDDGTVSSILAAQQRYRSWYEESVRNRIIAERAEWESTQPIAPNQGIRDQIWEAHFQQSTAAAMREPPPALAVAEEKNGVLQAGGGLTPPTPEPEAGEIPDLTATQWKPVDSQYVFIYGGGQLAMFPSRGLVMEPVGEPLPRTTTVPAPTEVPNLLPSGPVGMAPPAPRPITPWMLLPAIGKESHVIVRTSQGLALVFDAGGPRAITLDRFTNASARLGGVNVASILITHPHDDHIRYLLELIEAHNIAPEELVLSQHWPEVEGALRTTAHGPLLDLGYGPNWTGPRIGMAAGPVTETTIRSGSLDVHIIALSAAHREYAAAKAREAAGGPEVRSKKGDKASLLYIYGNESSSNRTLFLGDFRGEDVLELHHEMGAERFRAALRNVRIIVGAGHHFSHTAGRSVSDVQGLNLLIESALVQNGELTILVQSREGFAFEGPITTAGPEGALLRYFIRQGVRVVFAGAGEGGAVVDSTGAVTIHGTGVTEIGGDARVVQVYERLNLLREARRTAEEKFGPAALEMAGAPAEIQARLDADIERLEGLLRELRGYAAADLLDERGPEATGGQKPKRIRDRQRYRTENTRPGRSADQVLADMAAEGPAEQALSKPVRERLRRAIASGRSVALELEFANVPPDILKAVPAGEQREALGREYRELSEIAARVEGGMVQPAQRLEVLARAITLRDALRRALPADGPARTTVEAELARINSVVERLEARTVKEVEIGRDTEGRQTRTEYIRLRQSELVGRGFHEAGRVMGALMVIHSVSEMGAIVDAAARDKLTIPEAVFRVAHTAYGMNIGVRMARTTFREAMAGTGAKVGAWEFAVLAVLEVSAAALADYDTTEQRNAAILGTAIHSSVDLLCMYAGMAVMGWGAKIPHPLGKLAVMGLGLAITMAGEKILSFLGLDEAVQRWTSFPPGEVTHVQQRIDSTLHEYRLLIGAQQLATGSDADIRGLGLNDPEKVRDLAASVGSHAESALRNKESELTYLFREGYDRARSSWVGLQMLDEQAAEFTRLRGLAMADRADPNRTNLDKSWRAIDPLLDLSNADETAIRRMEQWSSIDSKIAEVRHGMSGGVNFHKVFESMEELQLMMDNARYRVDSPVRRTGRQVLRPVAMIFPGGKAYATYMELLTARENELATLQAELMQAGGRTADNNLYQPGMDLQAALLRLRAIRQTYDAQVEAAAAEHPELALSSTWKDPSNLAKLAVEASRKHPDMFNKLRLSELTLQSAARQAEFTLSTESPQPGESFRQIARAEIDGVNDAIFARREVRGLVFPHELDTILEERGAQEDALLAAQIDAAHPRARTAPDKPVQPPTPEEFEALSASPLSSVGGDITTTVRQLARARKELAPARVFERGGPEPSMSDYFSGKALDIWNVMGRAIAERQFAVLTPSYRIYVSGWVDSYPLRSVEPGRNPIVCTLPGGHNGCSSQRCFGGPAYYQRVIAVNPDAVAELGPDPVYIRLHEGLRGISKEELTQLPGASTQ